MYKKLFAVMVIAIFLITSVGVISATDDSISVKIVWDSNGNDMPNSVTVNLIKDGAVVDTAKLSSDNGWKTTFKVDGDGDYQVKEVIGSDYLSKVYGNAKNGFVIKNHLVSSDVLGTDDDSSLDNEEIAASDSDSSNADDPTSDDNLSDSDTPATDVDTNTNEQNPVSADDSTGTEEGNSTGDDTNGTDDANSTDDSTDNSTDDSKSKDDSTKKDSKTTKTTTKTTTTTKIIKHDKKKPENTTKSKMNHTGFPLIVLIIAVFAAIFIPLNRKR